MVVPPPPRNRGCFLRGPCMLCFLVHSASPPAREEQKPPPAQRDSPPPPLLYAASLRAPEERAARRLLRLSPLATAAWEARGRRCRRLLLSGLLLPSSPPPPPPPPRGFLAPALQTGEASAEMVCKRKGVGLPACPPCKQPRCAPGTAAGAQSPSPPPEAAGCQQGALPESHLCPLPCASDCAKLEASPKDSGGGRGAAQSESASQLPELGGRDKQESREPDCEEPPENPGDCCPEPQPPSPDINQLPPSILLKVGSQGW